MDPCPQKALLDGTKLAPYYKDLICQFFFYLPVLSLSTSL